MGFWCRVLLAGAAKHFLASDVIPFAYPVTHGFNADKSQSLHAFTLMFVYVVAMKLHCNRQPLGKLLNLDSGSVYSAGFGLGILFVTHALDPF